MRYLRLKPIQFPLSCMRLRLSNKALVQILLGIEMCILFRFYFRF